MSLFSDCTSAARWGAGKIGSMLGEILNCYKINMPYVMLGLKSHVNVKFMGYITMCVQL